MTFPAQKTTEFTVDYINQTGTSDDYNFWAEHFTYITHTGSYWAKPISKAVFEYCNPDFINIINTIPPGNDRFWIDNGDTELSAEWTVNPDQYRVDNAKKCLVWERSNWKPKAYEDDIRIMFKWMKTTFIGKDGFHKSRDNFLVNMCGKGYSQGKHFGERINISDVKMTEQILSEALFSEIDRQSDQTLPTESNTRKYPSHIRSDLQLSALRYLRNYLYALHDYEFKNETLANCFSDVSAIDAWTQISHDNLELIQRMEYRLKKENQSAWRKVRKLMQDQGAFKRDTRL